MSGALAYNESFGGTPNELSIGSTGAGGAYTIVDRFQTITLTRNAIALGWTGNGTNSVTGPVASVSSLTIAAANQTSTLFVESVDAPAAISGFEAVNVGETFGGASVTVQGIRQPLTIDNPGGQTSLTIDDSSEATSRAWNVRASAVSGASPAPIQFAPGAISQLTIDGGSGGNQVAVFDTGATTLIRAGAGADVVNVTGATADLTIDGQGVAAPTFGALDSVIVTTGPAVAGAVSVTGQTQQTMLTVDDSGSLADRAATLAAGMLTGLTARPLLFGPAALSGLILQGGAGADALTVDCAGANPVPASSGLNYDGGPGRNSLILKGGTFQEERISTGGPGAGSISLDGSLLQFANLSPIADAVTAATVLFDTSGLTSKTINIVNGPAINGVATTEVNSGDVPPQFELVDLANKTNVVVQALSDGVAGAGPNITLNNPQGGAGLSGLSVITDATDDHITITASPAGVATAVNTGGGNDTVVVAAAGLGARGTVALDGGAGTNVLNADAAGGAVTLTASSVNVAGHPSIGLARFAQVNVVRAADEPLTPIAATLRGTEGVSLANVVAGSFSDADPAGQAGNFTATIDWGDGTPAAAGTVAQPGGPGTAFRVVGSHTYRASGLFAVTIQVVDHGNTSTTTLGGVPFTVSDLGGSTTTVASTSDVAVSSISATALPIPPVVEGQVLRAPVASFRVADPATTDVFTAAIDWGDGTSPSAGTVARQPDGSFLVTGTHTYTRESPPGRPYLVVVAIVPPRGRETTVVTSATVLEDLVVRTAADSGLHSLRDVILDIDADGFGGTITFDIPGSGPHRITLLSALPQVSVPVVIDATSQPGFHGRPLIELSGRQAGAGAVGLRIAGGTSTVKGFVINGFDGAGLVLERSGGDRVVGNLIGTDLSGTVAVGNGDGVDINNVGGNFLGGTTPAERNVVSGNRVVGVRLDALGAMANRVQGNFIGTDVSGRAALPNYQGVLINGAPRNLIGGAVLGAGNVISGNVSAGIQIFNDATVFNGRPQFNPPGVATGNVVQGNVIGTDASGTGRLGNMQGIFVNDAPANLVGGTSPSAGNVISGNRSIGIQILGDHATRNAVLGNAIGTDRTRTRRLGNQVGVYLYASPGNVVDLSNSPSGNAIVFNASANLQMRSLSQGPSVERVDLLPRASGPISGLVLTFTTYLDPQRAASAGSYRVTTLGRNGRATSRPLSAIAYDDINRTVTLRFATPVARSATLRLVVLGTSPGGLTDQAGNFLDGDPSLPRRSTGSNFQATFVRGSRVGV